MNIFIIYGFREDSSTSSAILDLVEEISSSIDGGEYTLGVFIDLKKAFDTIDHNILLNKLNYYGVRGITNEWVGSYLSDRQQYVIYNGV